MSESEKLMCVCGKKRENLNITNWKRHLDNCKQRKTKITSRSITSFFNTPKPKKVCMDTDTIHYPYATPDGKSYTYLYLIITASFCKCKNRKIIFFFLFYFSINYISCV